MPPFPPAGAALVRRCGGQENPGSLIAGLPVPEVWKAKTSVVLRRLVVAGYAGVDNPLFYRENTRMQFGDAKVSIDGVLQALKS